VTDDIQRPIRIQSETGLVAEILPFGARLAALWVPTRRGPVNVVLGMPRAEDYSQDRNFLGCTIGRVSGRIARSVFTLAGQRHVLETNDSPHHLHGGTKGFHAQAWQVRGPHGAPASTVLLELHSPDGAGGYPGALDAQARFTLEGDALCVELRARSDRPTPVGMTLHPYFNLSGAHDQPINDHSLTINADEILELDATLIPTGRQMPVTGTPFDFRDATTVGDGLAQRDPQLQLARGFDHTYLLRPQRTFDAELTHSGSGVTMRVSSLQPGMQFYTGQWLQPAAGVSWQQQCGLCLEPQGLPNAVNEPRFAAPWLQPGELYANDIRYAFSSAPDQQPSRRPQPARDA
jgi:aldose 1-epimerase